MVNGLKLTKARRALPCAVAVAIILFLVAGCKWKPQVTVTGYIEGRLSFISSPRPGNLASLLVRRGSAITIGQKLFTLEAQPESDIVNQLQADVDRLMVKQEQAKVNLAHADSLLNRREILAARSVLSQEDLENVQVAKKNAAKELQVTSSQLEAVRAQLNVAKWDSTKKEIRAEKAGIIFDTYFVPSEFVPAGKPVLSILSKEDRYIVFYVPEYLLPKVTVKKKISVACDGAKTPFYATVSFVYPKAEFAPPIVYTDKSRASLVYKVEADIDKNISHGCLHLGQPVDITLPTD
jgi:HlyD family secretion protein